jgi:uroporphyrinogen decarboxylase
MSVTGRERILAALERREPDRLPTMEWVLDPGVMREMNGSGSDMEFARKAGLDGIAVSLNYRSTRIDDRHVLDEWGVTRVTYDDYPNPVKFPIKEQADFDAFSVPDPDDEYRYQSIRRALSELGEEIAVVARVKDIFSHPRDLMGFEDFLMGFYLQPELVASLMEMCIEHSTRIARNLKEIGVEVIVIGDDIANNLGLLVNPEMFMEQVYPHFKTLVGNFKEIGLKVIKHSDGDLRSIVAPLVETGIDCLDPIDPLGNMDIGEMKKTWGDRIALKGNVDCVSTLVDAEENQVIADTLRCILAASVGGGHIISSSNSIHSGISPKNYQLFLDTVHDYGVYPIDVERIEGRLKSLCR